MIRVATRPALGIFPALGILSMLALTVTARTQTAAPTAPTPPTAPTESWDAATVAAFRRLPIQDGDRVKPFATAMSLMLLQCNGKRSLRVPDDRRFGVIAKTTLSPTEWALDVLFRTEQADHYPCFEVADSSVLVDLGLHDIIKSRRAHYSYAELRSAAAQLRRRGGELAAIPPGEMSAFQRQQQRLCSSFSLYTRLRVAANFARVRFRVGQPIGLRTAFDGAEEVRFSALIERLPRVIALWRTLRNSGAHKPADQASGANGLKGVLRQLATTMHQSNLLRWLPPVEGADSKSWLTLDNLARTTDLPAVPDLTEHVEFLRRFEAVADAIAAQAIADPAVTNSASTDPGLLPSRAKRLQEHAKQLALADGSYGRLELEDTYNRSDLFYRGLYGFMFCFLVAAIAWLTPRRRWPWWIVNTTAVVSLVLVVAGITMRCVIRGRPPVTNLYETILFVTAGGVLLGLILELCNRRRVAISVASFLGAAGLFLAHRYELHEVSDTMTPLVAVLDTNFWLATHVTTVTMGYLAGLLAGLLAYVYLLGKLFVRGNQNDEFFRDVARMVYGVLCFGAFFATLGTVLGGIWANESWGRFWGWDPKENGALLIVLYMLFILHGRLGGYLRDFGVCTMAVLGNAVVAWSWWGVNELNTGLHSYGNIQGVSFWLTIFYLVQVAVVLPGLLMKLATWRHRAPAEAGQAESRQAPSVAG